MKDLNISNHGGNIREASEKYKIPRDKIIDFSYNINPLGINKKIINCIKKEMKTLLYYPDIDCKKLKKSMSCYYNIDEKNILPGNGSIELIYLLANYLDIKKAIIIQPNFSEYELSLKHTKIKIEHIIGEKKNDFKVSPEKIINKISDSSIVYVSNPNNPAGYVYLKDELLFILKECKKKNSFLFIDEVFLDFLADYNDLTMTDQIVDNKNLIILKSLTKIFAIPGIRLGFVIAHKDMISNLKDRKIPWSVNNFAQIIGASINDYKSYIEKTREYVYKERTFLIEQLKSIAGIKFYQSKINYILCKIISNKKLNDLKDYLGKNRIIIRDCSNYIGLNDKYFRIAVRAHKDNELLVNLLKSFFKD